MIRVLLVDDHASSRDALAFLLGLQPDIDVHGTAGSLAEARDLLPGADVILLDLDLPDGDGSELLPFSYAVNPYARVLVLSGSRNQLDYARAIEAGADGTLIKTATTGQIIESIRRLAAGELVLDPADHVALVRLAAEQRRQGERQRRMIESLTPRECEILELLKEGLSERQMADRLSVSPHTIHNHMANIINKLHVSSRLQALLVAIRIGAIGLDDDV